MGIEALDRRPRTTKPEPGHKIYPYLLRGMEITRPNQVWAMDITYITMARGFVYLAVVLDWFSRRVLSWRVSITMMLVPCDQIHDETKIVCRKFFPQLQRFRLATHPRTLLVATACWRVNLIMLVWEGAFPRAGCRL